MSNDSPVNPSLTSSTSEQPSSPYAEPVRFRNRWRLHIALFALTFVTTTLAGAEHYAGYLSEFSRRPVALDAWLVLNGLWYSGTILGILLAHELGHYLYCRWYNLDASLPYFIPLPPFVFLTGTLGAVIRIREPFRTRTELFDVGIAGPLAGLVVLIPALFYGLSQSPIIPAPTEGVVLSLGLPLLFQWAAAIVVGPVEAGQTINMHPMVLACWFGLFATALNLLPFGQLDGGHIVYAVLGPRIAKYVSTAAVLTPVLLVGLSWGWLLPALILALMWRFIGLGHPSPLNPYDHVSAGRRALAVVALIAFIACFTPAPLSIVELAGPPR